VATRYEKLAANYLAMVTIAATLIWLWLSNAPLYRVHASRLADEDNPALLMGSFSAEASLRLYLRESACQAARFDLRRSIEALGVFIQLSLDQPAIGELFVPRYGAQKPAALLVMHEDTLHEDGAIGECLPRGFPCPAVLPAVGRRGNIEDQAAAWHQRLP
jgi:hypothetical protein